VLAQPVALLADSDVFSSQLDMLLMLLANAD